MKFRRFSMLLFDIISMCLIIPILLSVLAFETKNWSIILIVICFAFIPCLVGIVAYFFVTWPIVVVKNDGITIHFFGIKKREFKWETIKRIKVYSSSLPFIHYEIISFFIIDDIIFKRSNITMFDKTRIDVMLSPKFIKCVMNSANNEVKEMLSEEYKNFPHVL